MKGGKETKCEEDFRAKLAAVLKARRDVSAASLSRRLGRNHAYLHQYLTRGSPRRLPLEHKLALADFLGLAPAELGVATPPPSRAETGAPRLDDLPVFRPEEAARLRSWLAQLPAPRRGKRRRIPQDRSVTDGLYLGPFLASALPQAAYVLVHGDNALAPAVRPGDLLIVDAQVREPMDDAIHVIDLGPAGVAARRIFRRGRDLVLLAADNVPAAALATVPRSDVIILGRVVALLRPLAGGWATAG